VQERCDLHAASLRQEDTHSHSQCLIIIITWRYSPTWALASCAIRFHWSLIMFNTRCLSTARMVTWTRLNTEYYVIRTLPALFRDIMLRQWVVGFRRFEATCHLRVEISKKTLLGRCDPCKRGHTPFPDLVNRRGYRRAFSYFRFISRRNWLLQPHQSWTGWRIFSWISTSPEQSFQTSSRAQQTSYAMGMGVPSPGVKATETRRWLQTFIWCGD
jgi:hypothetical protein